MEKEKTIATKEDELNALAKIRKIVEGLGENSYVGTAFDGVWGIATQNIDNDFANSVTFYLAAYYDSQDMKHKHEQTVNDLKASNKGLLTDLNIANERYADLFDEVNANDLTICNLHNEINILNISLCQIKADKDSQILTLKAKLYDLIEENQSK